MTEKIPMMIPRHVRADPYPFSVWYWVDEGDSSVGMDAIAEKVMLLDELRPLFFLCVCECGELEEVMFTEMEELYHPHFQTTEEIYNIISDQSIEEFGHP